MKTCFDNQRLGLRAFGFTLIELLVVMSIIAMLISILIPVLSNARKSAQYLKCLANQRQLGTGALMYANDERDYLPFNLPDPMNYAGTTLPYWWFETSLVEPLSYYLGSLNPNVTSQGGIKALMNCPHMEGSTGQVGSRIPSGSDFRYSSRQLYLPGLAERASASSWFDDPPTGANQRVADNPPNRIIIAERNLFLANTQQFDSNYAGTGRVGPIESFLQGLAPGSNRFYVDGHGEHAAYGKLGRDNTTPTSSPGDAHYSTSGLNRPYYW